MKILQSLANVSAPPLGIIITTVSPKKYILSEKISIPPEKMSTHPEKS